MLQTRICFKYQSRLSNSFRFQDPIPKDLIALVVYKFQCDLLSGSYYGESIRHADISETNQSILFVSISFIAIIYRRSRSEMFCENGALENFANFTRKHLCRSLFFKKVAGRSATLLKKRLWHRYFPVIFATFSRTPFFYRTPPVAAFAFTFFWQL